MQESIIEIEIFETKEWDPGIILNFELLNSSTYIKMLSGLSVEGKGEGIVVSAVEEGRLAHVQGNKWYVSWCL